jgi:hypothetical protein
LKIHVSYVESYYYHLHPLLKVENSFPNKDDEDCNLEVLEMVAITNEHAKELVNYELSIFQKYQVDMKDIKCPLDWWRKHKSLFLIVGFLI